MSDGSIRYQVDQDEIKRWDNWYLWRYMLEFVFYDEQLYEIGSEWFQHEIDKVAITAKLKLQPKRVPRMYQKVY